MPLLGRESIQKSLQRVLLISVGSALLLLTTGFILSDWLTSKENLYRHLESEAKLVGHNSVSALIFDDAISAQKSLMSLDGEEHVMGAAIYLSGGKRFVSFERIAGILPTQPPKTERGTTSPYLFVHLPIEFDGEMVGTIFVLSNNNAWLKQLYLRLSIVAGLFFLSMLMAIFIYCNLQRVVTYPVLSLAETARQISNSQNYSLRAEKLSKDEVGLLTDDFNEMLNQIETRDYELRIIQGQLEQKVQKRTRKFKELAETMRHQAFHDSLTGLANRKNFDDRLKETALHIDRHGGQFAVLFLDLDRFKLVNDTLGHSAGDRLLIEVASRLRESLRSTDLLARFGGDEFAVLLTDIDPSQAGDVAAKLISNVSKSMTIDGHQLIMTVSIGVSVYPDDGSNTVAILKNADAAMYRSKEHGRNRLTFFSAEMNERVERRLLLENKLRRALETYNFKLHYQPKWDTESLKMIGVEALIRWHDEDEGDIPPSEFIPLAEECGLIDSIDRWVLRTACEQILNFQSDGLDKLQLSVNLSPVHFLRSDVSELVANVLAETKFPADKLELEITESILGPEIDNVREQLQEVRDLGVEVAIDDFGTAYSSLSRLKKLPVTTLKIDRSFMNDLNDDDNGTIVKTIITMAKSLGLMVVAEGVETIDQYLLVKQYGCNTVQGFLFGRPVPIDELPINELMTAFKEKHKEAATKPV